MSDQAVKNRTPISLSGAAKDELAKMGIRDPLSSAPSGATGLTRVQGRPLMPKRAITSLDILNEAYDYEIPSSFSRGMRVELPGASLLLLSGTASIDDSGATVHVGDFGAQCLRTFRNLTQLLVAENASWHDIVRTTCYLRDIERDYEEFNILRTWFMKAAGLDPLPASTGIQAHLCRSDLLVEIEAMAIVPNK